MALTIMPLGDSITVGFRNDNDGIKEYYKNQYVRTVNYTSEYFGSADDYPYPNAMTWPWKLNEWVTNEPKYAGPYADPNLGSWRTHLNEVFGSQIQFVGDYYNGPNVNGAADTVASLEYDIAHYPVSPGTFAALGQVRQVLEDYAHQGYPGILAVELKTKIQSDVFNEVEKPNVILLMTGSNDLWSYGRTTGDDPGTKDTKEAYEGPLEEAKTRVGAIIDEILGKSPASEIFVATVPVPRDIPGGIDPANQIRRWVDLDPNKEGDQADLDPNTAGDQNASVAGKEWNQGIRSIVKEKMQGNTHLHLVDMEAGLPANGWDGKPDTPDDLMSSLTADPTGLHPTDAGYRQIALFWEKALVEQYPYLDPGHAPERELSAELKAYRPKVNDKENEPLVGFKGEDIGEGKGDGVDEIVAFSFRFPAYHHVTKARLILDLTPGDDLITSDELLFADNTSIRGPGGQAYGRQVLDDLTDGVRKTVTFDLLSIDTESGHPADLNGLLVDGDLDVVYADDAIIHSARLVISGDDSDHQQPTVVANPLPGLPKTLVYGGGGNNLLKGKSPDWIHGESGNDTIFGYGSNDTLYGGKGNDSVAGGDDDDVLVGGDDDDTLDGQNGNDSINGDLGDERYDGNDVINGGNGEDQVLAGGGRDTVYGGLDNDWLNGQWGSDWVSGDGGNDVIIGEDGNDTLYGGSGDDYFLAGKGGDYVTGGPGNDTITFDDILQTSKLYGFDKIRGFDNPGPKAGDVIDLQFIDARPDLAGDQAFKLVSADKPQWGGVWVFDHSWDNSTMVQGWIGPIPYAPHGDWFQFWILDGPNVHARDYTAEDFVL